MSRYRIAAEVLAVLALIGALLWGVHLVFEHQRDIGRNEVRQEWDRSRAKDAELLAARTAANQRGVDAAVIEGAKREQSIKAAAAGATAAATSMRDAIAAFQRGVSNSTAEAAIDRAITASTLLGECTERYRGVAEKADRHANDAATLNAGWPTK